MGNNQADGKNKLKRMEFYYNGKSYKFNLNPEEYQMTEPNRVNLTQTIGGAWIDEFGAGVPMITFKGITGFKQPSTGSPTYGWAKFEELRSIIKKVYNRVGQGQIVPSSKEMYFYNYTDGHYFVVTPVTFELMRSISRPHMYSYNVQLICQRSAVNANPVDKSSSANPGKIRRLK